MNKVFVYGIFVSENTRILRIGDNIKTYHAILEGYSLCAHSRCCAKNIEKNIVSYVSGLVIEVNDEQLYQMDQIERINVGLYRRITVNTSIGECYVYLE